MTSPGADWSPESLRWRLRLAIALVIFALGALVATAISLAYDEPLLTPVLLWSGVGALALARRYVPRSMTPEERSRMAVSAAWVVVAAILYIVAPVLLNGV